MQHLFELFLVFQRDLGHDVLPQFPRSPLSVMRYKQLRAAVVIAFIATLRTRLHMGVALIAALIPSQTPATKIQITVAFDSKTTIKIQYGGLAARAVQS